MKNRKIIKAAAFLLALLFVSFPCTVFAVESNVTGVAKNTVNIADNLNINAESCILMEMSSGTVLYESNADAALRPASVTKIMSILLVMEAIRNGRISLDDIVKVSENAASMGGSQVFLEPGEEMTVRELLKCVIISSANDAAVALAEYVAGSEEAFVAQMNVRAQELGMKNTNFVNTNGLDDSEDSQSHLTSARDIALMSRELMNNFPEITEYTTIWMDSIRNGEFGLTNTNRLIRFYKGATGLKTGSTSKAGFCISATAMRDGMHLVAVIMGSPTRDERNEAAKKLLDHGFANYSLYKNEGGKTDPVYVSGGKTDSVTGEYGVLSSILGKGCAGEVSFEININEDLKAPISKGDIIGYVSFFTNGEVIGEVPVTAAENVEKLGYFGLFFKIFSDILLK